MSGTPVSGTSGDSFSAGASVLGFLYQLRYSLAEALRRGMEQPELGIRIEFLDDVDFSAPGTPTELVQNKHRVDAVADLQDASPALWKTLRVWSARIADGMSPEDTALTLVTTGMASSGSIAAHLRVDDERDTDAALDRLVRIARESKNEGTRAARAEFLATDEELRAALVRRIQVLDGAAGLPDLADAIERQLRRSCEQHQTGYFRELLEGWWFDRCIAQLSADPSAVIAYTEIEARIDLLRSQFLDDNFPVDQWDTASHAVISDFEERLFLRQLRDIGIDDSRTLLRAVRDYLRAFSHRSSWTRGGVLDPSELQAFDERLKEEWEIHFSQMERSLGAAAAEERKTKLAQELFEWMEADADQSLRPQFQHRWATRGSYHGLTDEPAIGWHVDFRERYGVDATQAEVAS